MFLYVKVVLGNLLAQQTLGHFKRELNDENFPKELDEAYVPEHPPFTGVERADQA